MRFDREAKTILVFVGILVLVFGTFVAVKIYERNKYRAWLDDAGNIFRSAEEAERARVMSDTYGGSTPQETLRLYIAAVEEGDFELAARYFVEDGREEETIELRSLDQNGNIAKYLEILKRSENDGEEIGNTFRMRSKTLEGPYYFVRFIKYPNNIWKITEI